MARASHQGCDVFCLSLSPSHESSSASCSSSWTCSPAPQPLCLPHLWNMELTISPLLSHAPCSHQKSQESVMLCEGLQLVLSYAVCCVVRWKHFLVLIKALRTQVREKEVKMLRTANFLSCPLAPFETYLM